MTKAIVRTERIQVLLVLSQGAKSRRKILKTLQFKQKNCNQISRETGLDWWNAHKHLQRLLSAKLVNSLDFGHIKFYRLTLKGEETLKSILLKNKK